MPSLPARDGKVIAAPQIVILGAGASIAAYHDWGKIGPALPSMLNLIDLLSLRDSIVNAGYDPTTNFEALYDELASTQKDETLRKTIEDRVYEYFSSLSLPETPTIYDYLILSLREKDTIATFNWDPFLIQAYMRNENVAKTRRPRISFLHGNVKIGVCRTHRISGINGRVCSKCGNPFEPSKLLYPVPRRTIRMTHSLRVNGMCFDITSATVTISPFSVTAHRRRTSRLVILC